MKKLLLLTLMSVVLSACAKSPNVPVTNQKLSEIAPYPEAKVGYTRYTIHLPALSDESNARVEVLIGKNMNVDCNAHSLSGKVVQKELKGWGYSYYVVDKVGDGVSTLMACPDNATQKQFVTIHHNLGLLDYNSRLPIVFYVPSELTVQYRIWQPHTKTSQANAE